MILETRAMDRVRVGATAAARGFQPGRALAGALLAAAAGAVLLAWNLESFVGRFDTLGFLLQDVHSAGLTRLRTALWVAGVLAAASGLLALRSWQSALALTGCFMFVIGALAGPLVRAYLAPQTGLEESLIYRLRGFSAIAMVGGGYLLFLSRLPGLLAREAKGPERLVSGWLRLCVERWQAKRTLLRWGALGLLAFLLASAVGLLVLQDFPNSSDENSYATQARIFASGRLWVDAPVSPEFFRARSFVMDEERGRFFSKAFPGWAALLAVGVVAGAPWVVNPLLSAATLILAGWAGGRLLGRHGDLAVVGLILPTPFFLLNAGSYYNHPAMVLMITLFLVATIHLFERPSPVWAIVAGLALGAAIWIRPGSALPLTLPFGVWLAAGWVRKGRWGLLASAAAPVAMALAGIALYNRVMFGSIWQTGYGAYDPGDIQAGLGMDHLAITGWWLLKLFLWLVPGTLAGLWLLLKGRRLRDWVRQDPILGLMLLSLAGLVLTYLLFQNKGGNEYGPRYYYDGVVYLAILLAAGWMRAPEAFEGVVAKATVRRAAALALGFGAVLSIFASIPFLMYHYRDKVSHNRDLFASVERSGRSSALVFLETGSGRMPPGDLVRNPLDFRSGVVYAKDLGLEADQALAALYADRPALVYAYDPVARRSSLRPLGGEEQRR